METQQYSPQYDAPYGSPNAISAMEGSAQGASRAASFAAASHLSITRAYAEMAVGLAISAVMAMLTSSQGWLDWLLLTLGSWSWYGVIIAQVALAIGISAGAMRMPAALSRSLFYVYAASMGFTLSTIFTIYNIDSITLVFAMCAGFFLALTMLGLTTKVDLLKFGNIFMVALIVLVIAQVVMMFIAPSDMMLKVTTSVGILVFAGITAYDAQKTRALFAQFAGEPERVKRLSIVCALTLYLDFINMFVYLLQLVGRRD